MGSGETVNMYGALMAEVEKDGNGAYKIGRLDVFYDPDSFLKVCHFSSALEQRHEQRREEA